MNALLGLRKSMPITGVIPFKYLLYAALLSNVVQYVEDDTKWGIFVETESDLYDYFPDWASSDERLDEVYNALQELADEGFIFFDDDERIFLGEFRGRKFFPFEAKTSLYSEAHELLEDSLEQFSKSKSGVCRSRSRFIRSKISDMLEKGIEKLTPGDFTELHGYLYEIYTGGEIYNLRNKVEYFQTSNMLKAYDKSTVFALLVEGVLHFDKYRKKGVPTLTTVACMKDDVMRSLTHKDAGSKEYMREMSSSTSGSGF